MRIGVLFDPHVGDKAPSTRKDDYRTSILNKLDFIVEQANIRKYKAVLVAGDLFHRKIPAHNSHALISSLISIFSKCKCPIYVIAGNHDISGNLTNLWQQPIYVLLKSGVINLLEGTSPIEIEDGDFKVSINGSPFLSQRDSKESSDLYNLEHTETATVKIGMFHQMILPDGMKFFSDYINFSDLLNINSDIIIVGHYHVGFNPPVQSVGDKFFVNGGALSRGTSEHFNREKKPSYIELSLTPGLDNTYTLNYEEVIVPHKEASKIFDLVAIERRKETQAMKDFISNLSEFEADSLTSQTPEGILRMLEVMGMSAELSPIAEKYLTSAYERMNV